MRTGRNWREVVMEHKCVHFFINLVVYFLVHVYNLQGSVPSCPTRISISDTSGQSHSTQAHSVLHLDPSMLHTHTHMIHMQFVALSLFFCCLPITVFCFSCLSSSPTRLSRKNSCSHCSAKRSNQQIGEAKCHPGEEWENGFLINVLILCSISLLRKITELSGI